MWTRVFIILFVCVVCVRVYNRTKNEGGLLKKLVAGTLIIWTEAVKTLGFFNVTLNLRSHLIIW